MPITTGYYKEIHGQDGQDSGDDSLIGDGNQEGMAQIIRKNVSDLLYRSHFLLYGKDAQVRIYPEPSSDIYPMFF